MDNLLDLQPKQWNLLVSPPRTKLLVDIAHLAYSDELVVLDCGRKYDPSIVARAARGRKEIIDRVKVQRAFTCHEASILIERTPTQNKPIVILDFLTTFQDENIKINTRKYLLENSLRHIQRLSQSAGVAVSVNHPPTSSDAIPLFERLQSATSHIASFEPSGKEKPHSGFLSNKATPTITDTLHREEENLARYRRALRREDQTAFDDLFISAYKHRSAAAYAGHLLPFETFLLSSEIENIKKIKKLEERISRLESLLDRFLSDQE